MRILFFLVTTVISLQAKSVYAPEYEAVYAKITDICHPTYEDFVLLQDYLNNGERPYLKWVNTVYEGGDSLRYDLRVRNMKLVDPTSYPRGGYQLQKVYFNQNPADLECCVISFASLNNNYGYPKKVEELGRACYEVGYRGHYLYRVGGWPDIEGGSLRLAHVPYAFKVCMMREARRLGYKKVLWLDSSMRPLKNFGELFEIMEREGYVTWSFYHLNAHGTEIARKASGLSMEEYCSNRQAIGGIIGINFEHPKGQALFDAWYKATEELDPCLSSRPEQVCLGSIIYQLGLSFVGYWDEVYTADKNWIHPYHYFFVCY